MINTRVKLTFPENLVREPIVGKLVQEFSVMPNIRRAAVEENVGWIICELGGADVDVEKAIEWMVDLGVQVDRLSDIVES
jgi:ABC-type methionine transport system ATPase subunit